MIVGLNLYESKDKCKELCEQTSECKDLKISRYDRWPTYTECTLFKECSY